MAGDAASLRPAGPRWPARAVWAVWLATVLLSVLAVPYRYGQLAAPCAGARCADDNTLLSAQSAAELQALGFSLRQYAVYAVAAAVLHSGLCWALTYLLLRRQPREPMALLTALALGTGGFLGTLLNGLPAALPWTTLPVALIVYTGYLAFILVFYLFPDGRFVPGWTRWLVLALAVDEFVYVFWPTSGLRQTAWYSAVDGLLWLGTFFAVAVTQLYRYRWVSGPVQRVQTRWVVFGVSLSLLSLLALLLAGVLLGYRQDPRFELLLAFFTPWAALLAPLTLALAILRYRLWDIDVLIRRTLVYSVLTALLALVYLGSVVGLQGVLTVLTGAQRSELVTVLSTLAIAALFVPLRRRVQAFIDRRFYRRKYDAARTLARFGATLRDEVDLDRLSAYLLAAVDETLQPESVGLWLK